MDRIPILKLGNLLLITIQSEIYDSLGIKLLNDIAETLEKHNSKGILLDISSVPIIDSFMGRIINNIASISGLMDAQTVVVGMQPAVAITLVELGLEMPNILTAINVEHGIELLNEKITKLNRIDETDQGEKDTD
ncbi:STAS domain-containing protein [Flexithrix dorotheae]|uniref:STAS domain-containing protein n=1 Tax=Flexithrix dorotheae TaxID=70993 RepID=UPI000476EAFA|nr:STAS domain-containing protein [Flexithrix dorotheae]